MELDYNSVISEPVETVTNVEPYVDKRDVGAAVILSWVGSLIFHKDRNYFVLGAFVKYFFFWDVTASWHFQSSSN